MLLSRVGIHDTDTDFQYYCLSCGKRYCFIGDAYHCCTDKPTFICPGCGARFATIKDIDDCECWRRNYDEK